MSVVRERRADSLEYLVLGHRFGGRSNARILRFGCSQ
jgi:hypothetical protein